MMTVRVAVHEAWDEIAMQVDPSKSVAAVKADALHAARIIEDPDAFEMKFRGAALRMESASLAECGVPDGAALIVLRRRRRPVR
jgi:hypothetical protein